ncbi:MAG: LLM class flavin-dependent oxidoreductase [bacterium]|nr:LLM class flavin-dependent oxidoreductase [bacterium]
MKPEYILEKGNVRKLIKSLTALEGKTLTQLKIGINQKFNKTDTLENLTNKLRNDTVRVTELLEIFDILGFDIIVRKK